MRPRRMIIEAPSGDARPKPPEYRPPRPAVAAPPMSPGGEGTRLLRREAEGGRGGALRWRAPEGPAGQAYPAVVPWDVLCLCVLLAPLLLAAAVSPVVALWALGTAASAGGGGAAYLAGLPGALRGAAFLAGAAFLGSLALVPRRVAREPDALRIDFPGAGASRWARCWSWRCWGLAASALSWTSSRGGAHFPSGGRSAASPGFLRARASCSCS
ncbi:unnamed protein product [Prorocentrum cordatum]|uniref:Uncharacterized protein n=1 Tax=Prorocentrum cordatum TaxID=2364126 RepID=A0ABN9WSW5_9DINO|nr:unnamed protein product [Polarella glacialis]